MAASGGSAHFLYIFGLSVHHILKAAHVIFMWNMQSNMYMCQINAME